jgi:K+-transporting ATPase ATPase B chain
VVDTARGTRRVAREDRQAGAAGAPRNRGVFDPKLLRGALGPAVRKMNPLELAKNPVMFVVEVTAALVTVILVSDFLGLTKAAANEVGRATGFEFQIAVWLWFTVYFATYAEALAEARGKAQAATLRKTRSETMAHRRGEDGSFEDVGSSALRSGDVVVVREGETIPGDGDVIEGVAYVNEAVITGESAPVLKEPGTDIRSSVTGGTTLTSDTLTICITANPGETFLDRMIALVEGAKRQRTPNEIALSILLSGLTIVFLLATATLRPFGLYAGAPLGIVVLVALLVCLIPTTIGGLLSAIGIAGMDRVARRRGRDPARQDRHDYVRQPAGVADRGLAGCDRARRSRGGAADLARGRDARRPVCRRARPKAFGGGRLGQSRRRTRRTGGSRHRHGRPLLGRVADERRNPHRRHGRPQGRSGCDRGGAGQ